MLKIVSHYCQAFLQRLLPTDAEHLPSVEQILGKNTITACGMMVYNVSHRGFYGIISDNGVKYLPVNLMDFPKYMRDRKRVKFTIEFYPRVSSIYKWGMTARLIHIEQIRDKKPPRLKGI
jgi:hypothetical protein